MKNIKVLLLSGLILGATVYAENEEIDFSDAVKKEISASGLLLSDNDEVIEQFESLVQSVLYSEKPSAEIRASLVLLRQCLRIAAVVAILSVGRFVDYNFINPKKKPVIHVPIEKPKTKTKTSFCGMALNQPEKGGWAFLPLAAILDLFSVAEDKSCKIEYKPAKTGALSMGFDLAAIMLLLASDFFIHANDKTLESLKSLEKFIHNMSSKQKTEVKKLFKDKYAARLSEKVNHIKNSDSALLSVARSGVAATDLIWALSIFLFGAHGDNKSPILVLGGLADIALIVHELINHPSNEKCKVFDRINSALA